MSSATVSEPTMLFSPDVHICSHTKDEDEEEEALSDGSARAQTHLWMHVGPPGVETPPRWEAAGVGGGGLAGPTQAFQKHSCMRALAFMSSFASPS